MRSAENAWLRDNFTEPAFILEDPNCASDTINLTGNMMLFQRSLTRGYCMHSPASRLKPVMLLFLSALNLQIKMSGACLRSAVETMLNSESYKSLLPYSLKPEYGKKGDPDYIADEVGDRVRMVLYLCGSTSVYTEKIAEWLRSEDTSNILLALDTLKQLGQDINSMIVPLIDACFGNRYDAAATWNALFLARTLAWDHITVENQRIILSAALSHIKRHPEFIDGLMKEAIEVGMESGTRVFGTKADGEREAHEMLYHYMVWYLSAFCRFPDTFNAAFDGLLARCRNKSYVRDIYRAYDMAKNIKKERWPD